MSTLIELEQAIVDTLHQEKAYNLPNICVLLGLDPGDESEAYDSKSVYVRKRLSGRPKSFLLEVAHKVLERYPSDKLQKILNDFQAKTGVKGNVKNLIFAANGPKPELILSDAVNNDIAIVKNAEYCLVYDSPIPEAGLLWENLVEWWAKRNNLDFPCDDTEFNLFYRLKESLSSKPECFLLDTYFKRFRRELGNRFPALIPQVYLHYDPKTIKELKEGKRIARQRMDFLILFSNQSRVVIEVDGKQHYAESNTASPQKYAEMVAADRQLRLSGYEIYRFGGYELNGANGELLVVSFFDKLFHNHGIIGT